MTQNRTTLHENTIPPYMINKIPLPNGYCHIWHGNIYARFNYLTSEFATRVVSLMEVCVLRNSKFVFKMRRFYDIRLQKRCVLEMRVKGHSKLLRELSFDRLCMVSH